MRCGCSPIGAYESDLSNVVSGCASCVLGIFWGIDKGVAFTSNNCWNERKADGFGSSISWTFPSGLTPSRLNGLIPPNIGGFFMV